MQTVIIFPVKQLTTLSTRKITQNILRRISGHFFKATEVRRQNLIECRFDKNRYLFCFAIAWKTKLRFPEISRSCNRHALDWNNSMGYKVMVLKKHRFYLRCIWIGRGWIVVYAIRSELSGAVAAAVAAAAHGRVQPDHGLMLLLLMLMELLLLLLVQEGNRDRAGHPDWFCWVCVYVLRSLFFHVTKMFV